SRNGTGSLLVNRSLAAQSKRNYEKAQDNRHGMAVSVKLDIKKSIEENASAYFEQAKKARKKLQGLEQAMKETEKREAQKKESPVEKKEKNIRRKLHWYEKFRWFISSDNILCVAGRDASTNELIIKKHTDTEDWVFHTDMAGSPFTIIKAKEVGGQEKVPETSIDEAAQFTASMSRAWKAGLGALDVFFVKPEQVSKEAQAGEHLGRGAFMIRGKTTYKHPKLGLAVCVIELDGAKKIMVAPSSACEKHALGEIVKIIQGTDKVSDVAKKLQKLLNTDEDLDTIIRCLPPGGVSIVEEKKKVKK
ncbi:DUF814 domain-containing protein, partial [Candidatus Woesearchaeota archaeon]|nr:DUF814 domain-containing protein [Candidatus Woesearchaeota archaeon]